MRLSKRPLSFEQEYPKHEFAPLVDLGMKAAFWAAKRRSIEPSKHADASLRVSRVDPISPTTRHRRAKLTTAPLVVMLALAATFTRVDADCRSAGAADSPATAPVDQERISGLTRTSEVLRNVVESYESDGLDTYNEDLGLPTESWVSLVNR